MGKLALLLAICLAVGTSYHFYPKTTTKVGHRIVSSTTAAAKAGYKMATCDDTGCKSK